MSRTSKARQQRRGGELNNRNEKRGQWELLKEAMGVEPESVDGQSAMRTEYYRLQLLEFVKGRFEIRCPEWWDKDFMLDLLLTRGRFFITNSRAGVMPFNGSAHGINAFLRNTKLTTTSVVGFLSNLEKKLFGKDSNACVVYLKDSKYYRSVIMQINVYAEKLASIDCSIDVNIMNSRVAFIFNARNTAQAKEAKLIFNKISNGEPAVFTDVAETLTSQDGTLLVQTLPVKDNYILDKLLEAKRAIIAEFMSYWGVNNVAYEKRERLLTDEINSNNEEIEGYIAYMQNNLKECSERVRNMFGIDFDIKIKEIRNNDAVKEKKEEENAD